MDRSNQFVWSVRAQRVASALRLDGKLPDELVGYGETLFSVLDPKECSVFATELRPVWYAVLERTRYMPPQIADCRLPPLSVRGKLGTHGTAVYAVQGLDEPPSVGDRVFVRSEQDTRVSRWTEVLVQEIKFGDFYYMDMI